MTFTQWLATYYPDGYDCEYSGTLAGLEDAWNAGVKAAYEAIRNDDYDGLTSDEFRSRFERKE